MKRNKKKGRGGEKGRDDGRGKKVEIWMQRRSKRAKDVKTPKKNILILNSRKFNNSKFFYISFLIMPHSKLLIVF